MYLKFSYLGRGSCMQVSQVQFTASNSFQDRDHLVAAVQIVIGVPASPYTAVLPLTWCAACNACADSWSHWMCHVLHL